MFTMYATDPSQNDEVVAHASYNALTGEFSADRILGVIGGDYFTIHTTMSNTDFNETWTQMYGSGAEYITSATSGKLTNKYDKDLLTKDLYDLLAYWPLNDDKIYPWRHDENSTIAPLVSRDEANTRAPDPFVGCTGYVDPGPWTGNVIGAPLPAGYSGHFQYRHNTFEVCDDGFGGIGWDFRFFGATAGMNMTGDVTDLYMPPACTQWTDNFAGTNLAPGAWIVCDPDPSGTVWAQKWAEIVVTRPSYNFFRPSGADRDMRDQTTVDCDLNPTGNLRYPNAWPINGRIALSAATNATPIVITLVAPASYLRTGDHVDISGVLGNTAANVTNGAVTRVDDTHFSLDGTVGNGAYTSGGLVISHGAPAYQWADENPKGQYVFAEWQFDFRDFAEGDRVCQQAFECNYCADSTVPGGVSCVMIDSTHYRSSLRYYQATHGMPREVKVFNASQRCLSITPCCPSVLAITPNGETWLNADVLSFPGTVPADARYGGRWQSGFVQHMIDPLWQIPHIPCDGSFDPLTDVWREDDGECHNDDEIDAATGKFIHWFPQRPWVENILAVPTGAPALPSGIYIGYLSLAALDVPGSPIGNVLAPVMQVGFDVPAGGGIGVPRTILSPWGIFLKELDCVCGTGFSSRFSGNYQANGVTC